VKRLHTMLRRDGLAINHKKVHRLYVEEGLQLRARRRRRRASVERQPAPWCREPNERWAMDFMHDVLATGTDGARVHPGRRVLAGVRGARGRALVQRRRRRPAVERRGRAGGALPAVIQCDNGTEFTSKALDHWAYWNRVQLDFSRPGKPVDNSVCEAFNGSLRRECLSRHWFASLAEARTELATWQADYNNHRPHTSLGHQSPVQFRRGGDYQPRAIR
jgi:putative transposase